MSLKKSLEKLKSLITAVEINQMNEGPVPTSPLPVNFINKQFNGEIDCKRCCYLGQVSIEGQIYAVVRCYIDGFYKQYIYNGDNQQYNIKCKPGTGNPAVNNTILDCKDWKVGAPIKFIQPPSN